MNGGRVTMFLQAPLQGRMGAARGRRQFGLMAYTVTERTAEIGIRMALGAGRADVIRLFMGRGLLLVLVGSSPAQSPRCRRCR